MSNLEVQNTGDKTAVRKVNLMPVPITSRAAKHLHVMFNYKKFDESSTWIDNFTLAPNEIVFGLYENNPGQRDGSIHITLKGLHLAAPDNRFLDYDEIRTIDYLHHDKTLLRNDPNSRVFIIHLVNGEIINLPILGAKGQYVDIAAFYDFVGGVLQTRRIERRNEANPPR